jgi:hypothetical protein
MSDGMEAKQQLVPRLTEWLARELNEERSGAGREERETEKKAVKSLF